MAMGIGSVLVRSACKCPIAGRKHDMAGALS
jgi:hypothetical protein